MKCKNPNCKDPTFLEKLGQVALEFKFCPACGLKFEASTSDEGGDGTETNARTTTTQSPSSEQAVSVQSRC